MPFGVTIEEIVQIRAQSQPRNPVIAQFLRDIRLASTVATSTPVMVIVGKRMPTDMEDTCFGCVTDDDTKPKRRLAELLKRHGLQMNQAITVLSDGGENVRYLQLWRALSLWRGDRNELCRVNGKPGHQHADGQAAAALDEAGRPSPPAGADAGAE